MKRTIFGNCLEINPDGAMKPSLGFTCQEISSENALAAPCGYTSIKMRQAFDTSLPTAMNKLLGDNRMIPLLLTSCIVFLNFVSGETGCYERTSSSGNKYCWANSCPGSKLENQERCLSNMDFYGQCDVLSF